MNTDKIIVSGIPQKVNCDKLTIYFQKKKGVDGGDVQSVTFPKSKREKDTAIIKFEEPETVRSVLQHEHKINKKSVDVKEYGPKVFSKTIALISPFVIAKLENQKRDVEVEFYNIQECTGASIEREVQAYQVEGEWYQVQAAFEQIESLVYEDGNNDTSPPRSATSENGYLSPTIAARRPSDSQSFGAAGGKQKDKIAPVLVLDKDIFTFIELVHYEKINSIKRKFGVDYDVETVDDAVKIRIKGVGRDSDPEGANKALMELYLKINKSAIQELLDLNKFGKVESGMVDNIIKTVQSEFPKVLISRVNDPASNLIFIADSKDMCRMAVEQISHFISSRVGMQRRQTSDEGDGEVYDRDIFNYIKLARLEELESLVKKHGVICQTVPKEDAVKIHFSSVSGKKGDIAAAKKDFKKLYSTVSKSSTQDLLDLNKFPGVESSAVDDILNTVKPEFPQVWISRMHDSTSQLIFIADTKQRCGMAIGQFEHFLHTRVGLKKEVKADSGKTDAVQNKIQVDGDIFAYAELVHADAMKQMWDANGARINRKAIDDCVEIEIVPNGDGKDFSPSRAITSFQKFYGDLSDNIVQDNFDLKKFPSVTAQEVNAAIQRTRAGLRDVHVNTMLNYPDNVLFISDTADKCKTAMTLFGYAIESAYKPAF